MPTGDREERDEAVHDAARGTSWLFALSLATVAALAAAVPVIVRSAIGILGVESTTPIDWVPESFAPRRAYEEFTREFESGDVVIASWPGCTVGAPAIDRFIQAATGPEAPCDAAGRPWFKSVASGSQAVARLATPPLSLDREEALSRLEGVIVGPDGKQTCLVIGFTREGLADRRRATAWIRDLLLTTATSSADDLHLAGPVIDNVAVDDASAESMQVYGGPAALLVFLLTWRSLKSLRYSILVFLLSLACVGLCFASLAGCGDRMNPVLIVMPLLVLTLGVSGGIHLVNYLVEARQRGPAEGAALRAIGTGWLPCTLSAGTTALGLVSLVVSELEPIRVFGFHAAIGVMATLVILFLVVPGFFSRWPIRRRLLQDPVADGPAARFATFTIRRSAAIVAATAAALAVAAAGLPGIRTSVAIDTLFTPETRVIRDYRWLEEHIGPLAPIVAAHGGTARGVRADGTGVMPLINAIQKTLLHDLFTSFLSACGVITLVMMVVEGGVLSGAVAMIPNVFPMTLLFGLLGWTGAALDIGSVMTASVALGMAVDGTFHFLTFFRRGLATPGVDTPAAAAAGRAAAVHAAYRHSAAALCASSFVCGLGILAFAGSSFAPTRRFAWMLSLLVAAALVGDLVVLPALLAGPAGRWFKAGRS